MDIKKHKSKILAILALVSGLIGLVHYAGADIPCPEFICVGAPVVTGNVVNDIYYSTNTVEISSTQESVGVEHHQCRVFDDGSVKCWGLNEQGQLGLGDTIERAGDVYNMPADLPAVDLGTGRRAVSVAVGGGHNCALLDNASIKCWGYNLQGQLGLGDTNSRGDELNEMGDNLPAVDLGVGRSATAVTAGGSFSCALLDNGSVKCWGDGFHGELGRGNTNRYGNYPDQMGDNLPAVELGTGRTATAISSGVQHTCALLDNGNVKCWGTNFGLLGLGDTENRGDDANEMGDNLPAVDLGTGRTAIALDVGITHTCVILDNGDMKCWGFNQYGELGFGPLNDYYRISIGDEAGEMGDNLTAIDLGIGRTATAISLGLYHTCAQLDNHAVKCWGINEYNKLRQGDINVTVPIEDNQPFGFRRKVLFSLDNGINWSEIAKNEMGYKKEQAFFDVDPFNPDNIAEGAEFKILKSGRIIVYWSEYLDETRMRARFRLFDSNGLPLTGTMSPRLGDVTVGSYPTTVEVAQKRGPSPSSEYITVMWTGSYTTTLGNEHKGLLYAQDYVIDDAELIARGTNGLLPEVGDRSNSIAGGVGGFYGLINLNNRFGDNDKPFYVIEDTYTSTLGRYYVMLEGYDYPLGNDPATIYGPNLFVINNRSPGWLSEYDQAPLFGTSPNFGEDGRYVEAWLENNRIYTQMYLSGGLGGGYFLPELLPTIGRYKTPKVHGLPSGGYVLVYQIQYNDTSSSYRGTKPIDIFYKVFDVNGIELEPGSKIVYQEPRFSGVENPDVLNKLILPAPTYVDGIQNSTFLDSVITETSPSGDPNFPHSVTSVTGNQLTPQIASLDGDDFVIMFHSVYYQDGLSYNMVSNKLNNATAMNSFFSVIGNNTNMAHYDGREWADCRYGQSVIDSCTHFGDYIFELKRMADGDLIAATRGGAYAAAVDKAKYTSKFLIFDKQKFYPLAQVAISQPLSGLETDIDLQYKVVNLDTGEEHLSPVKSLLYVNSSGADGSISYLDGLTNSTAVTVDVNMTCTNCDSLEISQHNAPLVAGVCGVYGAWQVIGGTSPLDTRRSLNPLDGQCYQYKAIASNSTFGVTYEYTSTNTIKIDRTAPLLTVLSSDLVGDALTLSLQLADAATGISGTTYNLNNTVPVNFTGQSFSAMVQDGVNRIIIEATDQAGNSTTVNHFVTANLAPPQINIVGLEEGGIYSGDIPLVYTLTQELTNVIITVDGVARSDLNGLADGSHTLVISGTDANGNPVSRTINFVVDSTAFSFQVLSPQNTEYQFNDLNLQYAASKPVNTLSYTLNGGAAQTDTNLQNLADGSYLMVITASSVDGDVASYTVNFTVKQSIPVLDVLSPVNNAVYPSNTVALNFASDSTVTMQLDGNEIAATVPNFTFAEDGAHTLIVSATHPISGNNESRVINFRTDTVLPEVTLTSPEPRIYTSGNIPIDYISNKALSNVNYQVDSNVVESLENLASGNHVFRMTAIDDAGRDINISVSFEVAELEIVSPANNSRVISTVFPPSLDFQYQAQGNFSAYTVALDDAQANLLGQSQGPGSIIPLAMVPGNHELTLRGDINLQQVGRRVNFEIGTRNISVGSGSIDYSYTNCDININNCDVTAQLKIRNTGEYNINEPINVRLDHTDVNGYESFWFSIPSLDSKQDYILTSPVFKASLGDTLTVSVDPNSEIANELADDNSYSIEFTAGKITSAEPFLSLDNVYFEGVSAFNLISVTTAGPVDRVEFKLNGWTFENNSTTGDFTTLVDMGLLDKNQPCVEIRALSPAGIVLDVELQCFKVSSLNITGLTKYTYDWTVHASTPNHVIVNNIDTALMMQQSALQRKNVLVSPASIMAEIRENRRVKYKFNYDPATVTNRLDEITARWADDGFLGGSVSLPNGQTVITSTIDPAGGACNVDGAYSIPVSERIMDINDVYNEEIANINANLSIINSLSDNEKNVFNLFNSSGPLHYWAHDLYTIDNFFGDITGNDSIERMLTSFRGSNSVADLLSGFLDLKISNISWIRGEIPEVLGEANLTGNFVNQFFGDLCLVVDEGNRSIGLRIDGYYDWGLQDVSLNLSTKRIKVGATTYSYLDFGIPKTPLSLHVPLLLSKVKLQIDPINMNVPIDYGARLGIKVTDNNLDKFGPFHARLNVSMNHYQRLANADIQAYPLFIPFLFGFGAGADYNLYIDLKGGAKLDFIGGSGFTDEFLTRVDYDFSAKLYKRKKYCFLGRCTHRSWKLDKIVWARPEADENIPFGTPYTQQDVDTILQANNAPWLQ